MRKFAGAFLPALCILWSMLGSPSIGQTTFDPNGTVNRVAIIDQARLFEQSKFGLAAREELQLRSDALIEENRIIVEGFEKEEQQLVIDRQNLAPEEFREKADAFDARVRASRREQDAKLQELGNFLSQKQQQFFEEARPILIAIIQERGIDVVLSRESVLLSGQGVDITDLAIQRIDETLPNE